MGKTLYLECYSGISGDMTVAALLDLGGDRTVLDKVLRSLPISGFETKISRVVKSGIDACDFDDVHADIPYRDRDFHGPDPASHQNHRHRSRILPHG